MRNRFNKFSVLFCFLMMVLNSFEQNNQIGMSLSYARMDAFHGIQYSRVFSRCKQQLAVEWGVNRSYLQRRFFPRITMTTSWPILKKVPYQIAPLLSYGYALLKTNQSAKRHHQWHEIYGGLTVEVGNRWKGIVTLSGGWLMEQYFNAFLNRQSLAQTLGFNGTVSLVYCW
jgi:hypothetical protein